MLIKPGRQIKEYSSRHQSKYWAMINEKAVHY